jgi:predicted RND superfamily exporter protein
MSKALNDPGDKDYDRIPQSREAIAQYFELYAMNGDPEDFEAMVDFDYTRALLTIQYRAETLKEISLIEQKAQDLMKTDPHLTRIGGYSLIEKEICRSVVSGQYSSLLFAFMAIFVLLSVIFRNPKAGLMGSIPLVFAVTCTFGLMGWAGMELNIVTALLSSVSIGLGVDFTIQLFWKIRSEILAGQVMATAVKTALTTIGRGITINAFSVMLGFAVLFLSAFPVIRSFALLIIVSLFLCLASALVLIPALCLVIRPGFLFK